MNSTLVRLSTGRFIDIAAVVVARPYLQDGKLEGNGPHQGLALYLAGGHQVTLIGPEAEDMIGLLARIRLLVDHMSKPNPVPTVGNLHTLTGEELLMLPDDGAGNPKPQRPPGYKGGEAVKLHGYINAEGQHLCPSCATLIFPNVAQAAGVRPVFGTVFDQDVYRCSVCNQVA